MKKILDKTESIIERILMILLALFICVVITQVLARYFFNSPLTWTEQVARYMFIWMVMLGIPITYRKNMNAAFDLVTNKLSPKVKAIVDLINSFFITGFALFYLRFSVELVLRSTDTIAQGIDIPINYVYSAQPICSILLLVFCVEKVYKDIREIIPYDRKMRTSADVELTGGEEIC